jgi:hypothetical protein
LFEEIIIIEDDIFSIGKENISKIEIMILVLLVFKKQDE